MTRFLRCFLLLVAFSFAVDTMSQAPSDDVRQRAIRVGVMLPLHNINGDGKRMIEYYRGILMACDSLKQSGISVDIHAWNAAEDADIIQILHDNDAARCDIIFGPLYSKQMQAMSDFVQRNDIRLVIPFSINAPQLLTNPNIFQIWQSPTNVTNSSIDRYLENFKDYHPVFIDCNDSTSKKFPFTSGLRRQLDNRGIVYNITNLKSSEEQFSKAFSRTQKNIVILNTGRSQELGVAFAKLNGLLLKEPTLEISMFGYTEWLSYTRTHLDNFYKYDTYIPSAFHYNPLTPQTQRLEQKYRWNFHSDMQHALPRFALTGFDHAFFFLKGLHKYGKSFNGAAGMFGYPPVQTPLMFERLGNGGFQNRSVSLVHYTTDHRMEMIR
ncbi:MAG: peptidoglycan-binding protein LysM [Prevotella sp.]|nr:peptidoglycan-binding protein LysM [Prevotella sp.]